MIQSGESASVSAPLDPAQPHYRLPIISPLFVFADLDVLQVRVYSYKHLQEYILTLIIYALCIYLLCKATMIRTKLNMSL